MANLERESMNAVLENFDADMFLNLEYTEATSDQRKLVPQAWWPVRITELTIIKPKKIESKQEPGTMVMTSPQLRLTCVIEDEGLKEQMNIREGMELKCYPQIFLDVDATTGGLDMGTNRNITLGKLRTALGMNDAGVHFSLGMLRNSRIFYAHCKHQAKSEQEPDKIFERWEEFAAEPQHMKTAA